MHQIGQTVHLTCLILLSQLEAHLKKLVLLFFVRKITMNNICMMYLYMQKMHMSGSSK